MNRHMRLLTAAVTAACVMLAAQPAAAQPSTAISAGLGLIDRYYLFSDHIDTDKILKDALEGLEARADGIRVESAGERTYTVSAGHCDLRVAAPPNDRLRELQEAFEQVLALVEVCIPQWPEDLPTPELTLLNAAMGALDPYSAILEGTRQTEHRIQFSGRLAGIGARIGTREGRLSLITVYEGSPAAKAGLRDNDVVLRVDDHSTTNILVTDAVQKIRGPVGSDVVLTVERADETGKAEVLAITVTRGLVVIPSVTAKLLEGGIVHAEISHYSQTTPDDFRSRVGKLAAEAPVRGVVIDVRENSGGSMLGSAAIADMFLSSGVLITTAGREGKTVSGLSDEVNATFDTPFESLPVAILTAKRTASGSELMAASLRNHDRAILVGEQSFGKGTVQKTFRIPGGAVAKMTVGHFLPNKRPIPGGGMIPDIEVRSLGVGEEVVVLADRVPEELPYWLRTPAWALLDAREPVVRVTTVRTLPSLPAEGEEPDHELAEPAAEEEREDTALEVAATILRRFPSTSASRMLDFARVILAEIVARKDAELSAELGERGLDWSPGIRGQAAPELDAQLRSADELRAGEATDVIVALTNRGSEPLFRVRAQLESSAGLLNRRGVLFGKLAPGQTAEARVPVHPNQRTHTGRIEATVHAFDDQGYLGALGPRFLSVAGSDRARLQFRRKIVELEPGTLEVSVEVANRGTVAAENVEVSLKHDVKGDFELLDGIEKVDTLEPGAEQALRFRVKLLGSFAEPRLTTLNVANPAIDTFLQYELALAPTEGFSRWMQAPEIRLASVRETGEEGLYGIHATVIDEHGLSEVVARIDGDQIERVENGRPGIREFATTLPWRPAEGVKRYEISAIDDDGLRSFYTTGL